MRSVVRAGLGMGLTCAAAVSLTIELRAGESIGVSIARAQAAEHAAALRAAWLKSGHIASTNPVSLAITGGKVVKATVAVNRAPAAPTTNFSYTAPNGFGAIEFVFEEPNTRQVVVQYRQYPVALTPPTSGSLTVAQPLTDSQFGGITAAFSAWAAAGSWPIVNAFLFDATGAYTQYSESQIVSLFGLAAIAVTNAKPDTTALPSGRTRC